jgi:hypothetical protein
MNLIEIFFARKRLWQARQDIKILRTERDRLQQQNHSMRDGMRRCVTCEYRIDYTQRHDDSIGATTQHSPAPLDNEQ